MILHVGTTMFNAVHNLEKDQYFCNDYSLGLGAVQNCCNLYHKKNSTEKRLTTTTTQ